MAYHAYSQTIIHSQQMLMESSVHVMHSKMFWQYKNPSSYFVFHLRMSEYISPQIHSVPFHISISRSDPYNSDNCSRSNYTC